MALGRPKTPLTLTVEERTTLQSWGTPQPHGARRGAARPHRAGVRARPRQSNSGQEAPGIAPDGGPLAAAVHREAVGRAGG